MTGIYTPRVVINMMLSPMLRDNKNKSTCTVVPFHGYKISIAMDSSHRDGDLFRSDILVFDQSGTDVSSKFYQEDDTMIVGTSEELFRVMKRIEEMSK